MGSLVCLHAKRHTCDWHHVFCDARNRLLWSLSALDHHRSPPFLQQVQDPESESAYITRAMEMRKTCPAITLYCRASTNMVCIVYIQGSGFADFVRFFHPMAQYFGLSTTVPFPPLFKIFSQIAIFFVLEDTWHYFSHRLLHTPYFYKKIHKIHHQYSAPFGMAAEYASPIEVMILGLGTVGVPILWCAWTKDLHILTMYLWIVGRLFQAIDAHSGYEFPWSLHHFLPFWAGADHHDTHHEKFIGNYSSSFRWWDSLLDTESGAEAAARRRERKAARQDKKMR